MVTPDFGFWDAMVRERYWWQGIAENSNIWNVKICSKWFTRSWEIDHCLTSVWIFCQKLHVQVLHQSQFQWWSFLKHQNCQQESESVPHPPRQGPHLSIRIGIWILPSDTIRGNAIYTHPLTATASKNIIIIFAVMKTHFLEKLQKFQLYLTLHKFSEVIPIVCVWSNIAS